MKLHKRYLPLATALTVAAVLLPAIASSATSTETVHALAPYSWSPAAATVTPGGAITFKNESGINHGIIWTGGTAGVTPICNTGNGNIPIGTGNWSPSWSGSCTFSKAGTYTYECSFHMALMRGTVTAVVAGTPTASTGAASGVSETEATLKGTVNPEGKTTSYLFNYGTSASYGSKTSAEPAGEESKDKPVSIPVGSLLPGTTYHYQLVAENTAGTAFGEDKTFVTASPPGPPIATTGQATAIGETEATLTGTVNPGGQATSYFFEWGSGGSYTQKTAELQAGGDHSGHAESAVLSGLAPGGSYNFRIVAKNPSGPATGTAQVFTTASPPTPTPTTPTPTTPTTTTPTPPPGGAGPPVPPAPAGPNEPVAPFSGLLAKLARAQHGGAVRGSIEVPAAEAGSRLEVQLLAPSASLAKARRSASARVGRLVRAEVSTGKLSFVVPLDATARRALHRHHKLALTVKIVLTPRHGAEVTVTRSVVIHA